LEQQARAAFSAHRAVMRRLSIAALALEEAELARDAAQDQYLVRGGSLLDLLEAERTAFQASVDWISARLEANIGQIRLLHASGRLPGWFGDAWAFGGPAKRN
jgi:outer membrane protein TolC